MAVVNHEVLIADPGSGNPMWEVQKTYPCGEVAPVSQLSDVGVDSVLEIGDLSGPTRRILIKGSPLPIQNESSQIPTEQRHFLIEPFSDEAIVYFVKPEVNVDTVTRKGADGNKITGIIFDELSVEPVAKLQPGMYAKFLSKNGVVSEDVYVVQYE